MESKAYQVVTDRILALLEVGVCPWRRPWRAELCGGAANLASGRAYSGLNALVLPALGYASRFFLTFNQARALGAGVRRGERAAPVVFWKFLEREDRETGKRETIPLLRYFSVFNLEQIEPSEKLTELVARRQAAVPAPFEPIAECERIVAGYPAGPTIQHIGAKACYVHALDLVRMPAPESFASPAAYYSTLFHELGHSTGHEKRLGRFKGGRFGSEAYGREELAAEMTAAFLGDRAGIGSDCLGMSAAYLASWVRAIKEDPRAVVVAAGAAQKAANHILGESAGGETETAA